MKVQLETIADTLIEWFAKTKRQLPWRATYDPYHVWISEIMLQQTQMQRGIDYYNRWLERFPDVTSVATAPEQEILKYWEGLGYYARARNLHKAAEIISKELSGRVPCDYRTLLSLPGIGPYTAAAISSIAGNADIPVIDANVRRVYARLFDIDVAVTSGAGQEEVDRLAAKLMPPGKARKYNQAVMDFGGLVCLPRNPKCSQCPLELLCLARKNGTVDTRPVVGKKNKVVFLHNVAGLIFWNDLVYIQQRKDSAVWGGLWEFPGGEVDTKLKTSLKNEMIAKIIAEDCGLRVTVNAYLGTIKHQYTNHRITLDCFGCALRRRDISVLERVGDGFAWVHPEELEKYAFPAGPRKILEYLREDGFFACLS